MPDTRPELSQEYDPISLQEMTPNTEVPVVSEGTTRVDVGASEARATELLRSNWRRRISILPFNHPETHRPERAEIEEEPKEPPASRSAGGGNKPPTTPPETSRGAEFDDGDDGKNNHEKSPRISDSRDSPETNLPMLRGDVPHLSLGGNREKALERTPDEIAINEERRVELTTKAKETALPYQRAIREIVPDEPKKNWLGMKRGGSVERQFETHANGRTVTYQVTAGYEPYGETNDLTKADVKISRPDIHKKGTPSLSFEFGSTGLETATLDVPYGISRDPLKVLNSLPGGETLSEHLRAYVESGDRGSPTRGFTLRLTAKPDQISYQLRRAHTLYSWGEDGGTSAGYRQASWIYNPATDTFERFNNGWNKYSFQPLSNRMMDGRTPDNNSGARLNVTREEFFAQLRGILGLLPTQE